MNLTVIMLIGIAIALAMFFWPKLRRMVSKATSWDGALVGAKDSGDPIADTDRRLAYGLYDDAQSHITQAIQAEPTRDDFKAKLFFVLFVAGKSDEFRQAGENYREALRDKAEWHNVREMASQLCPDDPIFR